MRLAFSAACLFLAVLPVAAATAEEPGAQCGARDQMLDQLSEKYAEKPVAMGETPDGRQIELLSQRDGSTWTLIMTSPEGWSCMMAAGESWRELRVQQSRNTAPTE